MTNPQLKDPAALSAPARPYGSSLSDDLDVAICETEMVLSEAQGVPHSARECLACEAVYLCYAQLTFACDLETLRQLLTTLRCLERNPPPIRATALADMVIALNPITVEFGAGAPWTGEMAELAANGLTPFGEHPITVAVRGVGTRDTKRRLAYLFHSLGVPE